jgi:hypothetical protein
MKYKLIDKQIQKTEEFIVSQLSRITTYLAPLVPAYLVYHASLEHVTNNSIIGASLIATTIELLGLSIVSNWLNVKEYNRLFKNEKVSTAGTVWMVVFYIATILAIVFGLKINPEFFLWLALLSLSMLSLLSGISFVQRRQHVARMEEKEIELEEMEIESEMEKTYRRKKFEIEKQAELEELQIQHELKLKEMEMKVSPIKNETIEGETESEIETKAVENETKSGINLTTSQQKRLAEVITIIQKNEIPNYSGFQKVSGWSPSTASRYFNQAQELGIVYLNGNGNFHVNESKSKTLLGV